jgi:hypothetical protein
MPAAMLGQLAADFRTHAGAQTGIADLDDVMRARHGQCLRVGIGGDELHTGDTFIDHVLDSVTTRAANPDDLDDGAQCCVIDHIELHDELLISMCRSQAADLIVRDQTCRLETRLYCKNICVR